jgi:DNA-binding XRE family transcriptional regulator
MTTIGERFKQLRTSSGMRQVEFSKSIGISQGTLSEIEKEKYKPSIDTVIATSNVFGVTTDWLLKGEILKYEPDEKMSVAGDQLYNKILTAVNMEKQKFSENQNLSLSLVSRLFNLILISLYNSRNTQEEMRLIDIYRGLNRQGKEELIRIGQDISLFIADQKKNKIF